MTFRQPQILLALLSVPAILLFLIDALWLPAHFFSKQGEGHLDFVANVIFLNLLHVFLSFYLVYKLKEFRQLYSGYILPALAAITLLLVIALEYTFLLPTALNIFAAAHALFQSMGLFLLYYCKPKRRQWIKISCWVVLAALVLKFLNVIQFNNTYSAIAGILFFLVFASATTAPMGALFAFRFVLWLWSTPINGFSISALHGMEYVIVVGTLITTSQVRLTRLDWALMTALIAIPGAYLAYAHFNPSFPVIDTLLVSSVFLHYAMDTYSFRFNWPSPRQLILPLFIKP